MVSIQQAAINAAVAYLKTRITDAPIYSRWPTGDFTGSAITLIPAGTRRDTVLAPTLINSTPISATLTRAVYQVGQCIQPIQMDIWATSFDERDSLMAEVDAAIRAGFTSLTVNPPVFADPVALGFWVDIASGWESTDTKAYFIFESPDYEDTADAIKRRQYRATYMGDAYMNLVQSANAPRQTQIIVTDGIGNPIIVK